MQRWPSIRFNQVCLLFFEKIPIQCSIYHKGGCRWQHSYPWTLKRWVILDIQHFPVIFYQIVYQ